MKVVLLIIRTVVGLLFIFSGLVKANDPLGLSYKMQEFFEIWGTTALDTYSLWMSVAMNAFEIIAGFAILIGWRTRLITWLLLLLILFFTFLTGYTYVTGKPTNCGCFGDCLPITSQTSFLKDVLLTVLIAILFAAHRRIRPVAGVRTSNILLLVITVFAFGFQWYTLRYLPVVDCLPFRKNNNIARQMEIPAGAITDSFAIVFIYEKNGRQFEFTPAELPADLDSYNYVSRKDKLVRQGNAVPAIRGFELSGITGIDSTAPILSAPQAVLLFAEKFTDPVSDWSAQFTTLYTKARENNVPVYVITSFKDQAKMLFAPYAFSDVQVLSCDNTTIRTAARTNPCIYLIEEGTIREKQSVYRIERISNRIKMQRADQVAPAVADSLQTP